MNHEDKKIKQKTTCNIEGCKKKIFKYSYCTCHFYFYIPDKTEAIIVPTYRDSRKFKAQKKFASFIIEEFEHSIPKRAPKSDERVKTLKRMELEFERIFVSENNDIDSDIRNFRSWYERFNNFDNTKPRKQKREHKESNIYSEEETAAFISLEIEPTSDISLIKTAYRKLALRYHPDRNPLTAAEFREVNEAYIFLVE